MACAVSQPSTVPCHSPPLSWSDGSGSRLLPCPRLGSHHLCHGCQSAASWEGWGQLWGLRGVVATRTTSAAPPAAPRIVTTRWGRGQERGHTHPVLGVRLGHENRVYTESQGPLQPAELNTHTHSQTHRHTARHTAMSVCPGGTAAGCTELCVQRCVQSHVPGPCVHTRTRAEPVHSGTCQQHTPAHTHTHTHTHTQSRARPACTHQHACATQTLCTHLCTAWGRARVPTSTDLLAHKACAHQHVHTNACTLTRAHRACAHPYVHTDMCTPTHPYTAVHTYVCSVIHINTGMSHTGPCSHLQSLCTPTGTELCTDPLTPKSVQLHTRAHTTCACQHVCVHSAVLTSTPGHCAKQGVYTHF
ncbi:putative uncharacterized protein FLJ46204 [Melospiza georgiana]|uniref:putative uncharacterized protein FLJ46204 n=1 Tax=Melospiza georgiana TaxID=44398 RepID=UPI0025ABA2EB|nr:putative uncharacterized protein FLJ46204 [Melospiza georgiana]